jgi:hypothetical protein
MCSRRYCPVNIPQLNCQLIFSTICTQPQLPLQASTDAFLKLSCLLLLGMDQRILLMFLRAYSFPREHVYRAIPRKLPLFIRLFTRCSIATAIHTLIIIRHMRSNNNAIFCIRQSLQCNWETISKTLIMHRLLDNPRIIWFVNFADISHRIFSTR